MNWIKLFYEARTDAKLKKLTSEQFRCWFNLLLFSAEQGQRGVIVAEDFYLLALEVSDEDEDLLTETIARLQKLKMISHEEEEGVHTITFLRFEERQYDKPSARPEAVNERVKRHREAKKAADVTPNVTSETPVKRDVTRCNTTDKNREDETETREEKIRTDETRRDGEATAAPVPTEPEQVSVRPSVFLEQAPFPSVPDPVRPKPDFRRPSKRPPEWQLNPADISSLVKDGWTRQEIEWGIECGIEDGTVPHRARSVLHASILPDVREGKRPQRIAAIAVAEVNAAAQADMDAKAAAERAYNASELEKSNARLRRANAMILERQGDQSNANTNGTTGAG